MTSVTVNIDGPMRESGGATRTIDLANGWASRFSMASAVREPGRSSVLGVRVIAREVSGVWKQDITVTDAAGRTLGTLSPGADPNGAPSQSSEFEFVDETPLRGPLTFTPAAAEAVRVLVTLAWLA